MILEERGAAALEVFRTVCETFGVKCEATQVTGRVPRSMLEKSELADLIIMGRAGEHSEWLDGLVGSTTQTVVRRATRPVLVTATDVPGRPPRRLGPGRLGPECVSSHSGPSAAQRGRAGDRLGAACSVLQEAHTLGPALAFCELRAVLGVPGTHLLAAA